MNKVIEILMNRDGMSQFEAELYLRNVQAGVYELLGEEVSYDEVISYIEDNLGLEPDYIPDIIFFEK